MEHAASDGEGSRRAYTQLQHSSPFRTPSCHPERALSAEQPPEIAPHGAISVLV
jgi:hypothetical protein